MMLEGSFQRWVDSIEHRAIKYLPVHVRDIFKMMKRTGKHSGILGRVDPNNKRFLLWSAVAIGRNNFLNVHRDKDVTWSLVTVVAYDSSTEVLCYFVFPSLQCAVPLRNGDCLAFNATIPHCISARCSGDREAYCVSFYANAGMAGDNDKQTEITEGELLLERALWKLMKKVKK